MPFSDNPIVPNQGDGARQDGAWIGTVVQRSGYASRRIAAKVGTHYTGFPTNWPYADSACRQTTFGGARRWRALSVRQCALKRDPEVPDEQATW